MTDFLNTMTEILKSFVYGMNDFWNWLTTAWFTYNLDGIDYDVSPIMIFSFTGILIVAAVMLIKFLNPVN